MNRSETIDEILYLSGDEFETKTDFLELAYKSKKQLKQQLKKIKEYNKK